MNILDRLKELYRKGSILIKLIYINIAVFLAVKIIGVIYFFLSINNPDFMIVNWLAVPANLNELMIKPWTIITYMFLHNEIIHILFNMLWLFWFGQIFLQYLAPKKLLSVYILGGLSGAFLYIAAFNLFPVFDNILPVASALGASASIMAIFIAISLYVPDYTINLLLIGPVKLKYISLFVIVLDILSIPSSNSGGHIAHLGGAIFGLVYIMQYKKGKNITKGFDGFMDGLLGLFKKKRKIRVTHKKPADDFEYNRNKAKEQQEIDRILEKIKTHGYDKLTKPEKEKLFKMGR